MITLHTAKGDLAYVDDADQDLAQSRWYLNSNGYFMRYTGGGRAAPQQTTLHREILQRVQAAPSPRHYVDHRNGDKRDNRRSNLRWCTPSESNWNKGACGSNVGYRGVHQIKRLPHKYEAHITLQGRKRYLGLFNSAEEAARAYDVAAKAAGGAFARLNLPEAHGG